MECVYIILQQNLLRHILGFSDGTVASIKDFCEPCLWLRITMQGDITAPRQNKNPNIVKTSVKYSVRMKAHTSGEVNYEKDPFCAACLVILEFSLIFCYLLFDSLPFNALKTDKNGRHFADVIFKYILLNDDNYCVLIQISINRFPFKNSYHLFR